MPRRAYLSRGGSVPRRGFLSHGGHFSPLIQWPFLAHPWTKKELCIANQLVRVRVISERETTGYEPLELISRSGLVSEVFAYPFPGSLLSTFRELQSSTASTRHS